MKVLPLLIISVLLGPDFAQAQNPAPVGMSLAQAASRRFPQPVIVGSLINRTVLQPREDQSVLGRVRSVIKRADGMLAVVIDFGGIFGWFDRPIAVPLDAMALLGQYMEILDFTRDQLRSFKTFDPAEAAPLPLDSVIRVGLARPSH